MLTIPNPMNSLCANDLQSMTPTTEIVTDTKVSNPAISAMKSHGSEVTHTCKVWENTLTMPVQEIVPWNQITILGLSILHLALAQTNSPWIQLMKMPIAAEFCSNQAFAGRISLFPSNWRALTSDSWVLEIVTEGYHIPLISSPVQQTPPHSSHLPLEEQTALEDEIKSLLQK